MRTVNIHEAKTHFSKLINSVMKGNGIIIAVAGKPVAKLEPIGKKPKRRRGVLKGKIKIAKDFDVPLSPLRLSSRSFMAGFFGATGIKKMRKKWTLFSVLLFCLIGGFSSLRASSQDLSNDYCAFCDPAVLNYQKFYEDELVLVLYTHKPILPGHCLVISKRHVERFEMLTDEELMQIGRVIKKVDQAAMKVFETSSYLLLQKNGLEVGQTVPHVHFHYVPRKAGDDSSLKFIMQMSIANVKKSISPEEMGEVVEKMRQEMEQEA